MKYKGEKCRYLTASQYGNLLQALSSLDSYISVCMQMSLFRLGRLFTLFKLKRRVKSLTKEVKHSGKISYAKYREIILRVEEIQRLASVAMSDNFISLE